MEDGGGIISLVVDKKLKSCILNYHLGRLLLRLTRLLKEDHTKIKSFHLVIFWVFLCEACAFLASGKLYFYLHEACDFYTTNFLHSYIHAIFLSFVCCCVNACGCGLCLIQY